VQGCRAILLPEREVQLATNSPTDLSHLIADEQVELMHMLGVLYNTGFGVSMGVAKGCS
jgi:hypothetical protein